MKPLELKQPFWSKRNGNASATPLPKGLFSWTRRIDGLALFCFASGSYFLHGHGQMQSLAIFMLLAFPVACHRRLPIALRGLFPLPPELISYTFWVLWAGLTGWLVAVDVSLFWEGYRVLLQMLVMVWGGYAILRNQQQVYVVILAALVGGCVQIVAVASGMTSMRSLMVAQERVSGFTSNANSLGFQMNWCVLCALMLFRSPGRWRRIGWLVPILIVPPAAYVVLLSGSRKSLVAMVFLISGWSAFAVSPKSGLWSYTKRLIIAGMVIVVFSQAAPFIMQNTVVGTRFEEFLQKGHGNIKAAAEKNVRYELYKQGIAVFLEHPIFGVGLNNFQRYSISGEMTHSEYIEPLVTTGLLGFVLYQAFYFCLLVRTIRLLFWIKDLLTIYWLKMMLLGVATIMIIGFGTPHYTSIPVFVLLTAFSVYTWQLKQNLKVEKTAKQAQGMDSGYRYGKRLRRLFLRYPLRAHCFDGRRRHNDIEFL